MRRVAALAVLFAVSGCASTAVTPLSANTVQITVSAAPVCHATGTQAVAAHDAAIATLKNGFDSYVILGGEAQDNVGVVGYTPSVAHTYGSATFAGNYASGSSTTTYSGGAPIIAGTHDQTLTVQMFHANDPGAANAISARTVLGPDWQNIAAKGYSSTCL